MTNRKLVAYDRRNADFPLGFGDSKEEAVRRAKRNVDDPGFDQRNIAVVNTDDVVMNPERGKFEVSDTAEGV